LSDTQQRFHTGEQFQFIEGLDEKIIGTHFDGFDFVVEFAQSADNNDGDQRCMAIGFEFLADFVTRYFRHHEIK
jgi:hypothetical protein